MKRAFTLVEVAVAGSLIGVCVLSAVAVIPQGLRSQNQARMKAAAAATILTLSAKAGHGTGLSLLSTSSPANVTSYAQTTLPAVTNAIGLTLPPENVDLAVYYKGAHPVTDIRFESSGAVPTSPKTLYIVNPAPSKNDLTRRLLFSYVDGNNGAIHAVNTRAISVWLLNCDPLDAAKSKPPYSAQYLGTYTEYRP